LHEAVTSHSYPILRFVHAEPARAASAGRKEDVSVADFVFGQRFVLEVLNKLDEISHGEVGLIALPVISVLLAELKSLLIRHRHGFASVAQAFQGPVHQALMLPSEAPEENRGMVALQGRKWEFDRLMQVVNFATIGSGLVLQ